MSDTCNANDGVGNRILVTSVWEERAIFQLSFTCNFVCVFCLGKCVLLLLCFVWRFFFLPLGAWVKLRYIIVPIPVPLIYFC